MSWQSQVLVYIPPWLGGFNYWVFSYILNDLNFVFVFPPPRLGSLATHPNSTYLFHFKFSLMLNTFNNQENVSWQSQVLVYIPPWLGGFNYWVISPLALLVAILMSMLICGLPLQRDCEAELLPHPASHRGRMFYFPIICNLLYTPIVVGCLDCPIAGYLIRPERQHIIIVIINIIIKLRNRDAGWGQTTDPQICLASFRTTF